MEHAKTISKAKLLAGSRYNGIHYHAIFGGRKDLLENIFASGNPIYLDESYYVQEENLNRVEKVGDHFECGCIKNLESWRECHYFKGYFDAGGHFFWLMTGGRYD